MATQTGELGVTFPDNTLQTTAAIAGAPGFGGFTNMSVFTSTAFWVVPAGVTKCKVTVVGGGGGSSFGSDGYFFSPGCGGGTAIKIITGLTPGTSINVTIGSGGGGGINVSDQLDGKPGGTSSFGAYCSATGGAGGAWGGAPAPLGGGIGISGNINFRGGGTLVLGGYGFYGGGTYLAQPSSNQYGAGQGVYQDGTYNGLTGAAGVVIVEY